MEILEVEFSGCRTVLGRICKIKAGAMIQEALVMDMIQILVNTTRNKWRKAK